MQKGLGKNSRTLNIIPNKSKGQDCQKNKFGLEVSLHSNEFVEFFHLSSGTVILFLTRFFSSNCNQTFLFLIRYFNVVFFI